MSCDVPADTSLLATAQALWDAGLTPLPRLAHTPSPTYLTTAGECLPIYWGDYKAKQPPWSTVASWFAVGDLSTVGILLLTGTPAHAKDHEEPVLQILDIESAEVFDAWREALSFAGHADILYRCICERTPSQSAHVGFLCHAISDKQALPLAKRAADKKILIELLQHQTCTVAPTAIHCKPEHPREACYHVVQGRWDHPQVLSPAQRQVLIDAARAFNEVPEKVRHDSSEMASGVGTRPGDRLNTDADAAWWTDLLTTHGWRDVSPTGVRRKGLVYFQRPGKRGKQASATYGACGTFLYVFSSNADPFEAGTAYSPFGAYALLEHAGDYRAAGKALAKVYPPTDEERRAYLAQHRHAQDAADNALATTLAAPAAQQAYRRRQAAAIARYRAQINRDPYFGAPERRGTGITPAILVLENKETTRG
jgi:hypothetical protein